MFSMVSRFSSSVSFISLEGFLLGSHSVSTIPYSTELASKKGGNCKHVTLRAKVESSQSESHMITIIKDSTLVILTSTVMLHPVRLPLRAAVLSHPIHLTTYVLDSSLSMQLKSIFDYGNYLYFVHLLRDEVIISQTSLNSVEFEQLVGRNQTYFFLMQTTASSLI